MEGERTFSKMQTRRNRRAQFPSSPGKVGSIIESEAANHSKPSESHSRGVEKETWVLYELKSKLVPRRLRGSGQTSQTQKKNFGIAFDQERELGLIGGMKCKAACRYSSHAFPSTVQPSTRGSKIILYIWWSHLGAVYCRLLEPAAAVTCNLHRAQIMRFSRALKTGGQKTVKGPKK